MQKKILFIHHGKGLGGAPLSLLYVIKNLDKTKYTPIVLFLHSSDAIDLYHKHGIAVEGPVGLYDFPHTKIWWLKWYNIRYIFRSLLDTFKIKYSIASYWYNRIKPDIIHLNTSSLIAWGAVAHKNGIPVVWHIREPLASGYFGLRKKIIQHCVAKYSNAIVPICKNDSLPWNDLTKTQVVYNPVDATIFDPNVDPTEFLRLHNLDSISPKILFLGGLSQEKGTLVILQAFKQLLNHIPNALLLIAGYFDTTTNTGLKKYFPNQQFKKTVLQELTNLKSSVRLLGPISQVPQAMAASNIIVFPATVGHFARPVIEAGFMKKPVIASNLPPLDEIVIDNKTGFLVDPTNVNLWVLKLRELLEQESLAASMGQAAYNFCFEKFNVKNHVINLEKIYSSILEGK